jgi:hypothetical protein
VLFAGAAWAVRRVPRRTAVALILAGGIALCAAALSAPPRTSDDMYRYAWDGRVQAAGVSPYAYPPGAPQALSAWYVLRRGDPERPWRGSLLVTGTALLLTSPAYYWYALLVVALVAMGGPGEWLTVAAAGTALYIADALQWQQVQSFAYGSAAVTVLGGVLVRAQARGSGVRRCDDA